MDTTARNHNKVAAWLDPKLLPVDPYPIYDRLRAEGPVMWVPPLKRHLAASFDAVMAIEHDLDTFTAHEPTETSLNVRSTRVRSVARKDDPEHMNDRRPLVQNLKPKAVKELWTRIFEQTSDRYLDELIDAGPGSNFMEVFARPFAADNLRQVLGYPNATWQDVARWSTDLCDGIGNVHDDSEVWARCERTNDEIEQATKELVPRLKREPDGSVLSVLLQSDVPYDTSVANVKLSISGGINEPKNIVAAAIYALILDPEQRALIDDGTYSCPDLFEETLRWESPLGLFSRTVKRDTEFFGADLFQGDTISLLTGAANHDPAVFENPAKFDLRRPRKPHFGFGTGTHMCAGMWVARGSVGGVALPKIFRRFRGLKLAAGKEAKRSGWVFHGLDEFPLAWDHAQRSSEAGE